MDWLLVFLGVDLVLGILIFLWISGRVKDWDAERRRETEKFLASAGRVEKIFQKSELRSLPAPVQRYLRKTVKEGTPYISRARLKQSGQMRFNQRWIKIEADQYYTTEPPGFIWVARMKLGPAWLSARDRYRNAKGNMLIKILSAVPLFDNAGPEMDHASLLRYLSELPWLPTEMLSDKIAWKEIDDRAAEATITEDGLSASGVFHFNGADEIVSFDSPGRFRADTGKITPWEGTFSKYREINGFRIPAEGAAAWNAAGGHFEYIHLKVLEAEFNGSAEQKI